MGSQPKGGSGSSPQAEHPPSDSKRLTGIKPHIMHLHGKFHWIENGQVPHVPFEEIMRVLVQGGFRGWMPTEFEGGRLGAYPDSFEVVRAHEEVRG